MVALTTLFARFAHCPACVRHFSHLVSVVAAQIDDAVESWGNSDLLVSSAVWCSGGAGSKRRRADPHLKELASRAAAERKEAKASGLLSAGASTLRGWEEERLRELLAAGHIYFQSPHIVSSAFDAARIGHPAQDLLLHCLWHHAALGTLVLPPAVLSSLDEPFSTLDCPR